MIAATSRVNASTLALPPTASRAGASWVTLLAGVDLARAEQVQLEAADHIWLDPVAGLVFEEQRVLGTLHDTGATAHAAIIVS